jgi:hypothetical protein
MIHPQFAQPGASDWPLSRATPVFTTCTAASL